MKRLNNTVGLKIKFLPITNTKGARYKITQTNSNKSIIIDGWFSVEPLEYFNNVLEQIDCIDAYSLMIDNTQTDYYTFVINLKSNSINDLLGYFKK